MAESDSTTIQDQETSRKVEVSVARASYAAIERVKGFLTHLVSIAVLRIHAASGSELSSAAWREIYKGTPWVGFGEGPADILSVDMEEELNKVIIQQAGQAWLDLNELKIFDDFKMYELNEKGGAEPEAA
jgi:hypothetical protein